MAVYVGNDLFVGHENGRIIYAANPRIGFQSLTDSKVWGSFDYAGQELITAAAFSRCPVLEAAYLLPVELINPNGVPYVNPYTDLHTLTAIRCVNPQLIVKEVDKKKITIPEWEWRIVAEESGARFDAKVLNFSSIYLATPESIAERSYVKLELAQQWCKNHRATYPGFYDCAKEYGEIAAARGFAVSPVSGLIRWVDEERSGGREGGSPIRAAVNHAIQGVNNIRPFIR